MRNNILSATFASAILTFAASSTASAAAVVGGFDAVTQTRDDDRFDPTPAFTAPINFFGQTYSSGYVGSNGYITFGQGYDDYNPVGLGSGYTGVPIIAAFYADIETTPAAGGLVTFGNGTFEGRDAFGATWNAVGRYNDLTDLKNTFQILLVNRNDVGVGDFDIVLNYDSIQWDASNSSGAPSVGYSNGTGVAGTYYELPGSLQFGQFRDGDPRSLAANSNVGVAGRYLFNVRNGEVTPAPAVPEPATWATMILGFGFVGQGMRWRRARFTAA